MKSLRMIDTFSGIGRFSLAAFLLESALSPAVADPPRRKMLA